MKQYFPEEGIWTAYGEKVWRKRVGNGGLRFNE
jgi:hypothetical protein